MSIIIADIKEKAKKLLNIVDPYTQRQSKSYDSTKNLIIVAGVSLQGVTSSVISTSSFTSQENGIDYYYTTYHSVSESRTLTVNLLPTSPSLSLIRDLALKQQQVKGWFNIAVHENDEIVNVYRGWILSLPEIGMQMEAPDRQVVFGIKPMYSGVSVIDQPTNTEQEIYSKYNINNGNPTARDKSLIIDEDSGMITFPLGKGNSESLPDAPTPELPPE